MHKIVWCTDIHLDHLWEAARRPDGMYDGARQFSETKVKDFCKKILKREPDSVLITGDISIAPMIETHLYWLEKHIPNVPIYFTLGNHDFYNGSIAGVRAALKNHNGTNGRLVWLNTRGVIPLTENTALVGHDGWYDGGYGDWFNSRLVMTEYHVVKEMKFAHPNVVFELMQKLAKECASHIDTHVHAAAQTHKNVIFGTHVPGFRENSRAPNKQPSDSEWLPNMSSKATGDALLRAAKAFPGVTFTCLSGHTHTPWEQEYLPNLREITGMSNYGHPAESIRVIEVD